MKTLRLHETGASHRLSSYFSQRSAALANRLQQVLNNFSAPAITHGNVTWDAVNNGVYIVEPAPSKIPGKEIAYVQDDTGMEILVEPLIAIQYLQGIPLAEVTPEKIWDALNAASAESSFDAMPFSQSDADAEALWEKQISARTKKAEPRSEDWDLYERLKEMMGAEMLADEIMRAMSAVEAKETLSFIIQMHDLGSELGMDLEEEPEEDLEGAY